MTARPVVKARVAPRSENSFSSYPYCRPRAIGRREGIYVGRGFTATVNVELQIGSLQESVTVERNSPVVDTQSTAIAATFDAHQLANLPSARSMWAIQAATPAVHVARFDLGASATGLGGPISANGTAGFNRPMVEGISVTGTNPPGFP